MGKLITLKNGEVRTIMSIDDALEVVAEFVGDDIAECIKEEIHDIKEDIHYWQQESDMSETRCEAYANLIFSSQMLLESALKSLNNAKSELETVRDKFEEC